MNESKPGIRTTEFWTTLLSMVAGIMTMLGVFTPTESSQMVAGLSQIVGGVFVVVPVVGYVLSRGKVKSAVALSKTYKEDK